MNEAETRAEYIDPKLKASGCVKYPFFRQIVLSGGQLFAANLMMDVLLV